MPLSFIDHIACPQCKLIQPALITYRPPDPWPTYIHICTDCRYVIIESEWCTVPQIPSTREGPTQCINLS